MTTPIPVDILLVEDNPRDAELIIRAFKKHYLANQLFLVEDGPSALDFIFGRGAYAQHIGAQAPKVILLDLKLPKLDGLDVLRVLKADERTRRLPVVIVTSSREDPDIQAAYDLGANGYVVKPLEFDAFLEAMGRLGLFWLLVNQPPS